jgi:hypothetical protein
MMVSLSRLVPAILLATTVVVAPIQAVAAEPATASVQAPDLKPGDAWVFERSVERGTSNFTSQRLAFRIEHVGSDTMVIGLKPEGSPADFEEHVVGTDWSQRRLIDGAQATTGRPLSFPMAVGKTWSSDFVDPNRHGLQTSAAHHITYKAAGWEDVTTPAGTFHTIRIESDDKVKAQFLAANSAIGGAVTTADGSTVVAQSQTAGPRTVYMEIYSTIYYSPQVKYWVKTVDEQYNSESVRVLRRTDLLESFKPAP